MAEIRQPHKTDSQKSWRRRDTKFRDKRWKRKLWSRPFSAAAWLHRFASDWPLRFDG